MAVTGMQGGQGTRCSFLVLNHFQLVNTPLHLAHRPVLLPQQPSGCHQQCRTTLQTFQLLFYFYIRTAGVLGSESSFVTYPVLLLVTHCPSVSLQGSACCLLLVSRDSDLPLDALVHRSYRHGVLLLLWVFIGRSPLHTLMWWQNEFKAFKNWAFISMWPIFALENRKVCKAPTWRVNGKYASKWAQLLLDICREYKSTQ